MPQLLSVNVGLPRKIDWKGHVMRNAVWKEAVWNRLKVGRPNIDGDGQGDLQGHGGEQRTVLVYQIEFVSLPGKTARAKGLCVWTIRRELHRRGTIGR